VVMVKKGEVEREVRNSLRRDCLIKRVVYEAAILHTIYNWGETPEITDKLIELGVNDVINYAENMNGHKSLYEFFEEESMKIENGVYNDVNYLDKGRKVDPVLKKLAGNVVSRLYVGPFR
jgi:hypothetical protein